MFSIYISLGSGQDLGITEENHLVIKDYTNYEIDLGLATEARFEDLIEFLNRLKIHAVKLHRGDDGKLYNEHGEKV